MSHSGTGIEDENFLVINTESILSTVDYREGRYRSYR